METSIFEQHFWEWMLVFIILLSLIYTAWIIGNEQKAYEDDASWLQWQGFQWQIPNWWSKKVSTDQYLEFQRSDTYYEWMSVFEVVSSTTDTEASRALLETFSRAFFEQKQIQFDDEMTITENPEQIFLDQQFLAQVTTFVRVEGMATERQLERIYLDSCWFGLKDGRVFHCFSYSSVLNGSLEGPYFEEVIKRLKPTVTQPLKD